jgi:error-prone DNA polymerase
MGLRWVKGLALADGERILAARDGRPYGSVEDFARRARLESRAYAALAEAGALGGLAGSRRDALWQVAGWEKRQADTMSLGEAGSAWDGDGARFPALDKLDEIFWDYRASDHSTRGHPLGPLRPHLAGQRLPDARGVSRMRDGQRVDYVGVVICRQRPGTASGVTFMTMEDETGFVNVVVWSQVFEANSVIVRTAALLGVSGRLQIQEGIVHLIAESFFTPELPRPVITGQSRDFH